MITVVILNFEQIGQEEFKTIAYNKSFANNATLGDVLDWIKSIDPEKSLADVYINDRRYRHEKS